MTETPNSATSSVDVLRRRARRRLVGAAILALVAAIALPLVFEKEPPPLADEVDIRIPPVDKTPFSPVTSAVKPPAAPASAATSAVATPAATAVAIPTAPPPVQTIESPKPITPAPIVAAAPPESSKPVAAPTPSVEEKKADTPKKAPESEKKKEEPKATAPAATSADADGPKTDPKSGDYVVQLIAVRDANSALKVLETARGKGYKSAYRERVDVPNGVVTRVRTGPYKDKGFAERTRNKLEADGFEAVVVQIK